MLSPLAVRLRATRLRADLSMAALSRAAGAAQDCVRQLESGEIENPSSQLLIALARTLGVSLDWLVHGTGRPPSTLSLRRAAMRVREATSTR